MQPRDVMRGYQTAARIWLVAAACSLALPASVRLGWWLPLHLALAGAASVAISGAMQNFVAALTATGTAAAAIVGTQFVLVNAGAALIAAGRSAGVTALVAVGGTSFVLAAGLLAGIVLSGRRRALHLRHRVPVAMYQAAIACVLAGGAIGTILASGAVHSARVWLDLRGAHMVLNVLGWVSLAIAGTLITLLPTVLRVRMPAWAGALTVWLLVLGVATTAAGLALGQRVVPVVGAVLFGGGVVGLLLMVRRVASVRRRWPVPVSARHLLLALAWFASGAIWLVVATIRGPEWFAGAEAVFVLVFAGGWILQTLLGAWLYLLPMARPGHPDERRAALAAVEWGGTAQLVASNAGLVALALSASVARGSALAAVGAALALGGGAMALVKAWTFPLLGRSPLFTSRWRHVWDPAEHAPSSGGPPS